MQCVHINIRKATFILLSVLVNYVQHTQMAGNEMDLSTKDQNQKNSTVKDVDITTKNLKDSVLHCPLKEECNQFNFPCITCNYTINCTYGKTYNVPCRVETHVSNCNGKTFEREFTCRYCYQTEQWEHSCDLKANCNSVASPRSHYKTNCTVNSDVLCLGHRTFTKNVRCNWTGGYRWSTALMLSVTLGGFGADRFYLGHWQEGIGKLFSFGGLGVWTLIDVILISLHYLGPADGSLYI